MASDFQQQLALLRRRMAQIDRKFAESPRAEPIAEDDSAGGVEVETAFGRHLENERLFEIGSRHGVVDIASLNGLPPDLLHSISNGAVAAAPPESWAFLDTETTGLAGGAGTCAFLAGVGRIASDGFRVRQFFMRDHGEEPSLLASLASHLAGFRVLITYNGKAFDQPLLETRFRLARAPAPFDNLQHLDLLFGARRLWKLRLESCRLVELERQILGFEREGDVPGHLIPRLYFDYLRARRISRLMPVFHHNALDILTLACLTGIVPRAFHAPAQVDVRHGEELAGLARWWRRLDQPENALALFRRAVERGLPDSLLFRTLWDIAALEKKLGREQAALAVLTDLAASRNPFRAAALEELAKYYEHRERNYALALEMTRGAFDIGDTSALRLRRERLERRIAAGQGGEPD